MGTGLCVLGCVAEAGQTWLSVVLEMRETWLRKLAPSRPSCLTLVTLLTFSKLQLCHPGSENVMVAASFHIRTEREMLCGTGSLRLSTLFSRGW